MSTTAKLALLVGLVEWSDARGRWVMPREKFAEVVGVHVRTLDRAIRELEDVELIEVFFGLRPPGNSAPGRQGSNRFALDESLVVTSQGATERAPHVPQGATETAPPQGVHKSPPHKGRQNVHSGTRSYEVLNGSARAGEYRVWLDGTCDRCGTAGPVADDGTAELCERCLDPNAEPTLVDHSEPQLRDHAPEPILLPQLELADIDDTRGEGRDR